MRLCPDCGEVKPLEEFPRNRSARSGRGTYCKPCHNRRGKASTRRLYGSSRHYHLKERFGIGADEVAAMVEAQGGICPICQVNPAVHVDHDHATGLVRAIVCEPCNGGLGQFREDLATMGRAVSYLRSASLLESKERGR